MTLILAGCTDDTTAISQPEVQVSSAVTDAANSEDTQIAIAEPVQKDTSETPTPNEDSAEAMTDEMQALLKAGGDCK
jgi:chorismate synthase